MPSKNRPIKYSSNSFESFREQVIQDYRTALISRQCSLLGRKEVLTGKAKFGIFGDGKEVPQLAMAKSFENGDFRSGYYRDQTFMMAIGALTPEQFFAGLYAHTDIQADPMSAGRQMGGHFATHSLDENGNWKNLILQKNSSSDISPTAGQMPRLLGLAQASKIYRNDKSLHRGFDKFSKNGNEVAWGTIGDASTSEGLFFETINAAGVIQVPMIVSVWDNKYGISVHSKHQTTKEDISKILKGFQRDKKLNGYEILKVKGWDYKALVETYMRASEFARKEHIPVIIHVEELTQPQGHSTSGSHERYKNKTRLNWESDFDCIKKMREWMLETVFNDTPGNTIRLIEDESVLIDIEKEAVKEAQIAKKRAWEAFLTPLQQEQKELVSLLDRVTENYNDKTSILKLKNNLSSIKNVSRKDVLSTARKSLYYMRSSNSYGKKELSRWIESYMEINQRKYSSHLYNDSNNCSAIKVNQVLPIYSEEPREVDARIVLRDNFDSLLEDYPELIIFGQDTGKIGDVNQGLEGMQVKHGETRVFDTGIREATIIGQGIGMAMRGLRPIAEIQYLDYLLYGLQIMSDDLATLRYRTNGRQKAPLIIRTRGHRLEGIWHSGSPMQAILGALRGMYILVPRNMTKAAGFYNTLLVSDEPALIIENLNGYRLKEYLPENLGKFKTPIGKVEIIKEGSDITLVSYGSTLKIVNEVAFELQELEIYAEVIDVQSLLPFDLDHDIVKSLKKTGRLLIIDEDVPGGASSYILQEILEKQNGYRFLDSKPQTLTAKMHRPAYGTDGDYFSKPNYEDIFEKIYAIMHEVKPEQLPELY